MRPSQLRLRKENRIFGAAAANRPTSRFAMAAIRVVSFRLSNGQPKRQGESSSAPARPPGKTHFAMGAITKASRSLSVGAQR